MPQILRNQLGDAFCSSFSLFESCKNQVALIRQIPRPLHKFSKYVSKISSYFRVGLELVKANKALYCFSDSIKRSEYQDSSFIFVGSVCLLESEFHNQQAFFLINSL